MVVNITNQIVKYAGAVKYHVTVDEAPMSDEQAVVFVLYPMILRGTRK